MAAMDVVVGRTEGRKGVGAVRAAVMVGVVMAEVVVLRRRYGRRRTMVQVAQGVVGVQVMRVMLAESDSPAVSVQEETRANVSMERTPWLTTVVLSLR